jgi:16S rRNA (uracil1498-N3)-methyltransferase
VHRFLVDADDIVGERVTFSDLQAHQMRHVLRLRPGDQVVVFDGQEPADLLVELTSPTEARVLEARAQPAEPRTALVAYPALLQRDKFEPVLQKLTELGVRAISPVISARSLVREPPDHRRLLRWSAILREATEQCGRGVVPRLLETLPFAAAIGRATRAGLTLVAHPAEPERSLASLLAEAGETVSTFVGPEGGFDAGEVEMAVSLGAHVVTLGPRILRTETASPVLAALVLHALGDLSS